MVVRVGNNDDSFIMKDLADFSSLGDKLKEPLNRGKGGIWVNNSDFLGCF